MTPKYVRPKRDARAHPLQGSRLGPSRVGQVIAVIDPVPQGWMKNVRLEKPWHRDPGKRQGG